MRTLASLALLALLTRAAAPAASSPPPPETPHVTLAPLTVELADGSKVAATAGTITVPANRARRDGHTFELYFVRVPATPGAAGAPTFYLAGGPGEDATSFLRAPFAPAVLAEYRAVGDLVLVDQRGTGRSRPVPTCPATGPLPEDAFLDQAAFEVRAVAAIADCVAHWRAQGVEPSTFNDRDAADDVDDVRRALGIDRINLLGFSYGTHLALAVMRRHGEHLARVALVGTEGPQHTYKLPSTYDQQVAKLSLLAAQDPAVRADVPDLEALLRKVLVQLERQPVVVTIHERGSGRELHVPVGRWGLLRILRWDIGDGNDFVVFPALLHGIAHGDPSILGRYVEKRWNQLGRGIALMPLATDCSSGVDPLRWQRIAAEAPRSIFGTVTNDPFPAVCAPLGDVDLGPEMRVPLSATVPTLFVSGTLDSNTPPFQAEEVRWGLTDAVHLVVDNAGHEDTLPMPEVQRAIFDFLAGKDVRDRHVARPRPHFLSLAEAKSFHP